MVFMVIFKPVWNQSATSSKPNRHRALQRFRFGLKTETGPDQTETKPNGTGFRQTECITS